MNAFDELDKLSITFNLSNDKDVRTCLASTHETSQLDFCGIYSSLNFKVNIVSPYYSKTKLNYIRFYENN